ncbi:MAG TPA: hypothetical protein VNU93_00480 [Verrucomicrobiae bacterium]|nr:hypothetical protein [Verrucomicrobiae bacterium]
MNTDKISQMILQKAGIDAMPEDSGIIIPGGNIKKIFAGIDMGTPELLLAKDLGADLVISHHPQTGAPDVNFHRVMVRQIDKMVSAGVPINRAQKALREQMAKVERAHHPGNYDRAASAARLLNLPYMNLHLPVDILTENVVQNHLDKKLAGNPKATLKEVLAALEEIQEYARAEAKPVIRVGSEADYAGKVLVLMAGGTNGGEQVFKAYFDAGVGTIVCMHIPEDVRKAAIEQNIGNVIVAGHMASDSIGMNMLCDALKDMGAEVVRMGGII